MKGVFQRYLVMTLSYKRALVTVSRDTVLRVALVISCLRGRWQGRVVLNSIFPVSLNGYTTLRIAQLSGFNTHCHRGFSVPRAAGCHCINRRIDTAIDRGIDTSWPSSLQTHKPQVKGSPSYVCWRRDVLCYSTCVVRHGLSTSLQNGDCLLVIKQNKL